MHLIVCLDQRDGMLFNKRRQSRDRAVCARMLERAAGGRLWMNGYSARLFEGCSVTADEEFLHRAGEGEYAFLENGDLRPFAGAVESITVYRWGKVYPADTVFPWELFPGRRLIHTAEFAGRSHEEITEEVSEV